MNVNRRISRRGFGRVSVAALGGAALGCSARRDPQPREQGSGGRPTQSARLPGPNERFLEDQARRVVNSAFVPPARRATTQPAGQSPNTTPYDLHVPGGNMGYPAFWTRDAVMMLGADFISPRELEGWIRLMCSTLRGPDDWHVREGVVVPAYAVPDHVNFDGQATFYPGNYETGEKQGGHPWGKYPPLDDNFYFLTAVYEHWRLSRDLNLLRSRVRTFSGEERLLDLCQKIYHMPPSDAATGLVMAGDINTEHAKDWGFCDAEFKSGKLLFPSILKLIAARQLAELFTALRQAKKAAEFEHDAQRLGEAITATFLYPNNGGPEAWLHSATGVGNQPDVWGSAFAIHSGALHPLAELKVSRALRRAYRERTAVQAGQIRHIPTNDPANHGAWYASIVPPGTYQNGGYWATPVGWYIAALDKSDSAAAADLAREYIAFLRDHLRPDGTTEAWEWTNPQTGQQSNPLYVASVALPYLSLKQAGLLGLLDAGG